MHCTIYETETSSSAATFMYLTLALFLTVRNIAAIMSASITVDEPLQILKHMCCGSGKLCFCAMEQKAQYLFLTPIYSSFLVAAPKITQTPELAL